MKKNLRRLLIVLLCLSFLPAFSLGESTGSDEIHLTDFTSCKDIPKLLEAADQALSAGMDPESVSDGILALADEGNFLTGFIYAAENIAAAGSENTAALEAYCIPGRRIETDSEDVDIALDDAQTSPYETLDVSDQMKVLLADPGAQFCLRPYVWPESAFKEFYKVNWKQFKPKNPRPGYCCVIISDKSEATPGVSWEGGDVALSVIKDEVHALKCRLQDEQIIFTGNPNLASSFLVFDLSFSFYALYGTQEDSIRGYHSKLVMSWLESPNAKAVAEMNVMNKLEDRIYRWSDGIAYADPPKLYSENTYEGFVNKVRSSIATTKASLTANRRLTPANAESVLNNLLLQEAGKAKDAWQKAIYEKGAQNIALEGETISFSLRSWQPDLQSLGSYTNAEDRSAWLNTALENASRYNLEITLPLQDGAVSKNGAGILRTAVTKAAGAARKEFSGKDFQQALKDRLFPLPLTAAQIKSAEELVSLETASEPFKAWVQSRESFSIPDTAWAALLATRKNQALDVNKGPREMVLNCTDTLEPEDLLKKASYDVVDVAATMPVSDRPDKDTLENLLAQKLAEEVTDRKNQKAKKSALTFDLEEMKDGNVPASYQDFLNRFTWEDTLDSLKSSMNRLPDVPTQEMPPTGWISGSKTGTQINIRVDANSDPTYFIMRDASTDQIVVTAFVHPGKTAWIKVPSGYYTLAWCSGRYWYGYDTLFGEMGSYSKSESVEIKGTRYRHTFTLKAAENGNVSFGGADPEAFH